MNEELEDDVFREMWEERQAMAKGKPAVAAPGPAAAGAARPPLWPKPIPVIGCTGEYGSGKSLFGQTIWPGPETLVYDNEISSKSYSDLGCERIDVPATMLGLFKTTRPRPVDVFVWWRDHIRSIPPGKYRVIQLDPASEIESGLADYVLAHPTEFGKTAAQYARASALMWGDVREHWKMLLADLASRCETFCFTVHLKQVWADNRPTAKKTPKGKSTLEELASLYLWMERKPDAKGTLPLRPAAIVRKQRLIHTRIDAETGEVLIVPALPPRLPVATPAAIRKYQLAPPDYSALQPDELAPEEQLTEAEMIELRTGQATAEAEAERLKLERMDRQQKAATKTTRTVAVQTVKTEPAEDAPQAEPTTATEEPPAGRASEEQVQKLGRLRTMLFEAAPPEDPEATWAGILERRGVTSARDLTPEQAEDLAGTLAHHLSIADMEAELNGTAAAGEA